MLPKDLATNPGKLKYICHLHGELRAYVDVDIIKSDDILVSNWGSATADSVAESAVTLTLAVLKDMHRRIKAVENDDWQLPVGTHGGSLKDLKVGVYGAGYIGRQYINLIKAFGPIIKIYDPFIKSIPEGCQRVDTLEELFSDIELVAVHAGLTPQTRKSVSQELLALMPKYGVVINTARGGIIDQDALFGELASGRLRAGLDVLDPDYMEKGNPARKYENLILTTHNLGEDWPDEGKDPVKLSNMDNICVNNIRKFIAGEKIDEQYIMDIDRYNLST